MKSILKIGSLASVATLASTVVASAQSYGGNRYDYYCRYYGWYCDYTGGGTGGGNSVPEIDASSGLMALAAVFATLVLAWEIRRRKSAA